ncbi:MAG: L,D-transpeptidase [Rhizobium rosettiformans]
MDYKTEHPPGTIVVDPQNRFLYLIREKGKAVRYGVGVGKAGFEFSGNAHIGFKRQWPRWTPTPDMLKRDPARYGKWVHGMDGGDRNPLGARALYLVKDGKDTLYRIHGTNEPWTIGTAASSGCIRMLNQDVIDLYSQVPTGANIVVLGPAGP